MSLGNWCELVYKSSWNLGTNQLERLLWYHEEVFSSTTRHCCSSWLTEFIRDTLVRCMCTTTMGQTFSADSFSSEWLWCISNRAVCSLTGRSVVMLHLQHGRFVFCTRTKHTAAGVYINGNPLPRPSDIPSLVSGGSQSAHIEQKQQVDVGCVGHNKRAPCPLWEHPPSLALVVTAGSSRWR